MTYGEILAKYRKRKRLSQADVAHLLTSEGFPTSRRSISNWEAGFSNPSVDTLMHLLRLLEIPDFYEEYFGENPHNLLSRLNEAGKIKASDYISLLIRCGDYRKSSTPEVLPAGGGQRRLLPDFDEERVSAGFGTSLGEGRSRTIEVEDAPREADFTVRIQGDSMSPRFEDGQHVYVHQQPIVETGEIGIFALNGNAFIKKFRLDADGAWLVSLNEKYPPKPITDDSDFRTFGKVIGIVGAYRILEDTNL